MDADAFLREAHHFRLGALPTETPHPLTRDLAEQARHNLSAGIATLRQVDVHALQMLAQYSDRMADLRAAVRATHDGGGRVFLCGCGATGRLSVSLEVLWRETHGDDRVVGFMAGGDLAMVRSVENFEDIPEYGARQLEELGFRDGDLLISTTEGGETPFVIGATEHARGLSRRPPWFLYCNPDEVLRGTVERSRRVIDDAAIEKIALYVGPMGLSGSTRMQASTVLMLAVGIALLDDTPPQTAVLRFLARVQAARLDALAPLIELESAVYAGDGFALYETDRYGVTIVTDTTERSPTFSLRAFENLRDALRKPSLCFVHLRGTHTALESWQALLHRPPRALSWPEVEAVAGLDRLLGFDFSEAGRAARRALLVDAPQATMEVVREGDQMVLRLEDSVSVVENVAGLSLLEEHLLLKVMLNIHSTLVMGRLGRYERNLMTWVRPSNKKLIDRAVRYVQHLLQEEGDTRFDYDAVTRACFEVMRDLRDDEPIVLKVYQHLKRA